MADECAVEYSGCTGIGQGVAISTLSPTSEGCDRLFFDKFVKARTPVLFTNHAVDLHRTNHWSDSYLSERCADCPIKVERRSPGGTYGKGNEVRTSFREFLSEVPSGLTYLTTQDLEYDEDDRPSIISPPLTCLKEDFPMVLGIVPNLVVANINMWFGHTTDSTYSTSGLHHDFHDNVYVLLRGEKRITLYSPAEALNLYTVGRISRIHANGRINYHGQVQTRADGADLNAEAAVRASVRLQEAATRLSHLGSGAAKEVKVGGLDEEEEEEDELDRALEDVLDAEIDGEGEGDWEDDEDSYEEGSGSAEEGEEASTGSDSEEDGEGLCGAQLKRAQDLLGKGLRAALTGSKRALAQKGAGEGGSPQKQARICKSGDSGAAPIAPTAEGAGSSPLPANFSQVDTSLPAEEVQARFPLYAAALQRGAGTEVHLRAGQMLYIPAGWFHEVYSRSAPCSQAEAEAGAGAPGNYEPGRGGHLALNYWFHPPDCPRFEEPYCSDFWRRDFETRGLK